MSDTETHDTITLTAEELHKHTMAVEVELTNDGPYTCEDLTPKDESGGYKDCIACEFGSRLRRRLFGC